MLNEVTKVFDDRIRFKFRMNRDCMNHILKHPRKNLAINGICDQIQKIELQTYSIKFDQHKWKYIIENMADFFALQVLRHAEEQALSKAEIQRRHDEADYHNESERIFADMAKEVEREAIPTSRLNDVNGGYPWEK